MRNLRHERYSKGVFSNYCGLGGDGRTQHLVDEACKKHDAAYGILIAQGIDPYFKWNDADSEFVADLQKIHPGSIQELITWLGAMGYARAKEALLKGDGPEIEHNHKRSHSGLPASASQSNLPATAHKMPKRTHDGMVLHGAVPAPAPTEEHNMGNAPEEGGEQQVSQPKHVWRQFSNTQTAALRWIETIFLDDTLYASTQDPFGEAHLQSASNLGNTNGGNITAKDRLLANNAAGARMKGIVGTKPYLAQYRMTSPYGIVKQMGTTAFSGTTGARPNWLTYFDSKYQFYHVMETEWKLHYHFGWPNINGTNLSVEAIKDLHVYVFWRYTSQDDPPTSYNLIGGQTIIRKTMATNSATGPDYETATTADAAVGTTPVYLTATDYMNMGGWHHKRVSYNTTHANEVTISGKYSFGQCKMDIKMLNDTLHGGSTVTAEGWVQCGNTAPFPENLSVIILIDDATWGSNIDTATTAPLIPVSVRHSFEQLIQFKDLRAAYKFPTPGLSKVGTGATQIPTDEIYFKAGAAYA